jgi:hypothetical protein
MSNDMRPPFSYFDSAATRGDLDQLAAAHPDKALLFFYSKCHNAPALVAYSRDQGTLLLRCAKCSEPIILIQLEAPLSEN